MFKKYFEKLRLKFKKEIEEKNGIADLDSSLREKWELYNNTTDAKLNEYFSWSEFYEFFTHATVVVDITYGEYYIELHHDESFTLEVAGPDCDNIYRAACFDDLIDVPLINGKSLKTIWSDLVESDCVNKLIGEPKND